MNEKVAIAILPDHPTPCALKTHTHEPVPFMIYYPGIEPDEVEFYDEFSAAKGGFGVIQGNQFIQLFLSAR